MRINNNISALNSLSSLNRNDDALSRSLEKLSSGLRINRAADDAAGLSISEKMRGQVKGLNQASRNAQDGISLLQTAEGALSETHSILQRMRELAVQAANDTLTANDRTEIQKEMDQLGSEIDRIGSTTEFNTKKLLNGSAGVAVTVSNTNANTVTGTADTTAGLYSFSAATVATAKVATSSATFSGAAGAASLALASNLTVNGTTFAFSAGATIQSILDTVNAKTSTIGATLSYAVNQLALTTAEVGSASTLNVAGTGNLAFAAYTGGANATVTIASVAGSYSASGNKITYSTGAMAGLSFSVAAGAAFDITVGTNNSLKLQIGANKDQNMSVTIGDVQASALGVRGIDVTTQANANAAIATISTAMDTVSSERSKLGALQNRLDHTIANLGTAAENLSASESRVRDVDMAAEMSAFTRSQILMQASTAMMAQANQKTQGVLKLLG